MLVAEVLADGRARRLPVRIHVERHNPAVRLYQRFGFKNVSDAGFYVLMEWVAEETGQ